jgi:hypothetical protein
VHLIHHTARRQDNFHTPAAEIHDGDRPSDQVEVPQRAPQGKLRFVLRRNHLDRQTATLAHLTTERAPVGGFAHSTRGNGPKLRHFVTVGDRLHFHEGGDRALDRLRAQSAARVQLLAEPRHLPFFVEHPVRAVALDLGDDATNRIRSDVDRGKAHGARGRGGHQEGNSWRMPDPARSRPRFRVRVTRLLPEPYRTVGFRRNSRSYIRTSAAGCRVPLRGRATHRQADDRDGPYGFHQ